MSDPILTPEQVAALKTLWRQPVRAGAAAGELELPDDMRRACDSHEALRTERDAARRETEALRPVVEAACALRLSAQTEKANALNRGEIKSEEFVRWLRDSQQTLDDALAALASLPPLAKADDPHGSGRSGGGVATYDDARRFLLEMAGAVWAHVGSAVEMDSMWCIEMADRILRGEPSSSTPSETDPDEGWQRREGWDDGGPTKEGPTP